MWALKLVLEWDRQIRSWLADVSVCQAHNTQNWRAATLQSYSKTTRTQSDGQKMSQQAELWQVHIVTCFSWEVQWPLLFSYIGCVWISVTAKMAHEENYSGIRHWCYAWVSNMNFGCAWLCSKPNKDAIFVSSSVFACKRSSQLN